MGHQPDNAKPTTTGYPPTNTAYQPQYPAQPQPQPQAYGQGYDPSQYQHHNNYPPNPGPNPYPYQQPYNNYYYYSQQPQQYNYPNPVLVPQRRTPSFARIAFFILFIFLSFVLLLTLISWIYFGNYIPAFEVTNLKVSNFGTATNRLTGTWETDVSIENHNKKMTILFEDVSALMQYMDQDLAMSSLKGFQVSPDQLYVYNYSMNAVDNHQGPSEELTHQLKSEGFVIFNLRMVMKATFKSEDKIFRVHKLNLWCDNLQVRFKNNGEGIFEPIPGNSCVTSVEMV